MNKSVKKEALTEYLIETPKRKSNSILLFDIETSPLISYTWGIYEQNVVKVKKHWYIMTFAYKWLHEKKTHIVALPDFKLYKKEPANDYELCKKLHSVLSKAEIIVAHNGNAFDIKKANARFIQHRLDPLPPFKSIDTLKVARKHFKFTSNKLDDLGDYLNVGRKIKHEGFELWEKCMEGDIKSWKRMKKYNIQDVILLEKVYLKLRSWMTNHPNLNVIENRVDCCPNCGSFNLHKSGTSVTRVGKYQRYRCYNCGSWSRGEKMPLDKVIR